MRETYNITKKKSSISNIIQVIISYYKKLVTIAIHNIPMMFELYQELRIIHICSKKGQQHV